MAGRRLPLVWQHHDYGEWNIRRNGTELNVIDWESARSGLPLSDLLWLATYWSFAVRGLRGDAAQLDGFRQLALETGPAHPSLAAIRMAVDGYLRALGIDVRPAEACREISGPVLAPLLPMALLLVAVRPHLASPSLLAIVITSAAAGLTYACTYLAFGASPRERLTYRRFVVGLLRPSRWLIKA